MASVAVKQIFTNPLIIYTSTAHTFQENDNVYIGPREGKEDRYLTFVVATVTNTSLHVKHAYPNDHILQPLLPNNVANMSPNDYVIRCRAAIITNGNVTINVQNPLENHHIQFNLSKENNTQPMRWITSGNSDIIHKTGKVHTVRAKEDLFSNGVTAFNTYHNENFTAIRGSLSIQRKATSSKSNQILSIHANALSNTSMVLFQSESIRNGTIFTINGNISHAHNSKNTTLVHVDSNEQMSGKVIKLVSDNLNNGSMLNIHDKSNSRDANGEAGVFSIQSLANDDKFDVNVGSTTRIFQLRSMNANDTVGRIDSANITSGVLVDIDSINGTNVTNGNLPMVIYEERRVPPGFGVCRLRMRYKMRY